jgi:hypothetical protein
MTTNTQRTEPSVAQLRAVRVALEKAFGLAGWPATGLELASCPRFQICWDHPQMRSESNGFTAFNPDGTVIIALSTRQDAAGVHRTALHELAHLADYALRRRLSTEELELRAEVSAAMMARWIHPSRKQSERFE